MKYIDNKNGTITDISTGLMWKQDEENGKYTFEEANEIKSDFAGYNDWRVPTIQELFSLIDTDRLEAYKYQLDPLFNCESSWFWSSSASAVLDCMWFVAVTYGTVNLNYHHGLGGVRLVRNT